MILNSISNHVVARALDGPLGHDDETISGGLSRVSSISVLAFSRLVFVFL